MSKSFRQWLLDHGGIRQRGEGTESIHQLPVTTVLQKYDECAKQESEKRMDTIEIKLTRRNGDVTATKEFSVDAASVRDDFITGQAYSLFRTKLCELAVIQMQPFATRSLPRDLSKDPDEVIAETQDSVILDSSNPCSTFKQALWGNKCAVCGVAKYKHSTLLTKCPCSNWSCLIGSDDCSNCGFGYEAHRGVEQRTSPANSIIKTFIVPSDAPAKRPATVEE